MTSLNRYKKKDESKGIIYPKLTMYSRTTKSEQNATVSN